MSMNQTTSVETSCTQVTHLEFTLLAIKNLPKKGGHKGIHTVFSGFNAAFREHFKEDPVTIINNLVKAGNITMHPARGGVIIYDTRDRPVGQVSNTTANVLGKILGK